MLSTSAAPTLINPVSKYDYTATQAFVDDTGAPATLPETGAGGDEGKMRVLLGLLKKWAFLAVVLTLDSWASRT